MHSGDFSVTQILREINFEQSRSAKTTIFAVLGAVNVIHLANFPFKDLEVNSDKEDSRCLHVTVHKPTIGSTGGAPTPLLSAAFTFDDHIRFVREIL